MIERHQGRLQVKASMLVPNAATLLIAGRHAMHETEEIFDFAAVSEADSSALAVMLGWMRSAESAKKPLKFINVPDNIRALAELYGVEKLLPLA